MSQLPYIGQSQKDEHEKEINAKRSLMIGYDSDNLEYNKVKVNSDGSIDANVSATDLDIRNLTSTDVVTITGGAGQSADVKVTLDSESVAVTGPLTDSQLRASAVPVDTGLATQLYTDGDAAPTNPIAPSLTFNNAGNMAAVSSSTPLPVSANAGTDLNTSALALESGGNLAAINAKLVSGTDIGDVTINNTTSNPVPIQPPLSGFLTVKEFRASTGTNTSVADNAASTTILASNANRIGATVTNDSSAVLYLLLGSTAASTTNYSVRIAQYGYYEVPFGYTGQLTGIWASDPGDGAARVTEIT